MDESRKPDMTTIHWRHSFKEHKLCFQHDLFRVGKLMQGIRDFDRIALSQQLVGVQSTLLESVKTPELTAGSVFKTLDSTRQTSCRGVDG